MELPPDLVNGNSQRTNVKVPFRDREALDQLVPLAVRA
jgi:hypothetical protein